MLMNLFQEADDGYEDITSDDEEDGLICGDETDMQVC